MVMIIKQKQPHLPISISITSTYKHRGHMITIGKIPKIAKFFQTSQRLSYHQSMGAVLGFGDGHHYQPQCDYW